MVRNCGDIKALHPEAEDGEYKITLVDGNHSLIYCHNMRGAPVEFISLPAGPSKNSASYYHGSSSRYGVTVYRKVGINVTVSKDCP